MALYQLRKNAINSVNLISIVYLNQNVTTMYGFDIFYILSFTTRKTEIHSKDAIQSFHPSIISSLSFIYVEQRLLNINL